MHGLDLSVYVCICMLQPVRSYTMRDEQHFRDILLLDAHVALTVFSALDSVAEC